MTNDFLDLECYRYLNGEMTSVERLSFEERLRKDLDVERALARVTDAVAAHARTVAAPVPVDLNHSWEQIEARLTGIKPGGPAPFSFWTWAWPVAACLLGFVVVLDHLPWESDAHRNLPPVPPTASSEAPRVANPGTSAPAALAGSELRPGKAHADRVEPRATLAAEVAALQEEVETLREAKAQLVKENQWLLSQAESVLALGLGNGRRLTVLELVDRQSYVEGRRLGLADALKQMLTLRAGEGGVGTSVETVQPPTPLPPGMASPLQLTGVFDTPVTAVAKTPYAWSVVDEAQGESFHTFYNLPTVAQGEALYLWSRAADATNYTLVGSLPPVLAGRSGGVYVPNASGTAEILVTKQPANAIPTIPSENWVLRGP